MDLASDLIPLRQLLHTWLFRKGGQFIVRLELQNYI